MSLIPYDRDKHMPCSKADGKQIRMWLEICPDMPVLVDTKTGAVYQDDMQIAHVIFGYHKTWTGREPDLHGKDECF